MGCVRDIEIKKNKNRPPAASSMRDEVTRER